MEQIIGFLISLVLCLLIALVRSSNLPIGSKSAIVLERLKESGDKQAAKQLNLLKLSPTFEALKSLKTWLLIVILVVVLVFYFGFWWSIAIAAVELILLELVCARGWLNKSVALLVKSQSKYLLKVLKKVKPIISPFVRPDVTGITLNSVEELEDLVKQSDLDELEKSRILAYFRNNSAKVDQIMVPKENIITVDIKDSIGPLLLDKLHKTGHSVFPVVDKTLNRTKGWLYMSDLVPLDPDLKEVKDALRASVYTVDSNSATKDVVGLSLKTGRQIFLVTKNDSVVGMITLGDALSSLFGETIEKSVTVKKL